MRILKQLIISSSAAAVMLCCAALTAAAADVPQTDPGPAVSQSGTEPEVQLTDISACEVSFKYESYSYTGAPITPDDRGGNDEVTVTLDGVRLVKGQDYTVSYSDNTEIGYEGARLTVTGIGGYTGSRQVPFTVKTAKAALGSLTTSKGSIRAVWSPVKGALGYQLLYSKNSAFTGEVLTRTVTDRTYADLDDIPAAGEKWYVKVRAFITSDGTLDGVRYGSYSPVKSITVKGNIGGVSSKYQKYTYKGTAITPAVTVTDTRGNVLSPDCYTLSYANNLNVGTGSVTVKGKGAYQGTYVWNFTVKPNDLADNRVTIPALEYIYPGSPVKPTPTLKINGVKLTKNTDYYVTYSNNNAPGTATVTLTGMGNFSGSTSRTFTLKKPAAGTSTVGGTTYYADKNGNVERSVTGGVISYSDKYLEGTIKSLLNKKGYTIGRGLPSVDIDTISRGSSNRKVVITWKHFLDSQYTSYLLFKGDTYGKSWKLLKEIPVSDSSADYKYTNNISTFDSRFFRYALAGAVVRNGRKYISPLTFDAGWSKINICLDPGHFIGGNSNEEYSEGTQMLLLGGKLRSSLTSARLSGTAFANVKITRTGDGKTETFAPGVPCEKNTDYSKALAARGTYAKGCDFFISLHTNATSSNSWYTPTFWEVQCYVNNTANASKSDRQLAYDLGLAASKTIAPGGKTVESRDPFNSSLVRARLVSGDGETYKQGDTYYAVNRAADRVGVPGVLIEHSFHTNPSVRRWLLNDNNLAALGKAEASAILKHYGFPVE